MGLKVFFDVLSQPSRAVLIFCQANGLKFTPCPVALRKGENKKPEYTKISPFNRVPAIQDGDFTMVESPAIMEYLASKYKCAPHWYPSDVEKRAKVNEFISWYHLELRYPVSGYSYNKVMVPLVTGKPVEEKVLAAQLEKNLKAFSSIEKYFIKDKNFIAGDALSAADLIGVCEIMQLATFDLDFAKDHPKLRDWIQRVRNETNPYFDEAHKIVYMVGKVKDPSKL